MCFLASFGFAEVQLVSPLEKFVSENQAIELGSVQAGETIELIFSSNSGALRPWVSASASSLPIGWNAEQLAQPGNKNTLILQVMVPKESDAGAFMFKALLQDEAGNSQEASFLAFVEEGLLTAQVDSIKKTALAGEQIPFTFQLNNNSIAEHSITLYSSLPLTWFKPETIIVKPKSSKQFSTAISPKSYGEKKFSFYLKSNLNAKTLQEISPRVEVKPTLKNKYEAALYGFPFFTPSLIPYYIFNSFISQLS